MTYTQTELVSAALSDPANAPMTLAQIVSEEIREFLRSPQYRELLEADAYYRNRSDVQRKTNDLKERSNARIEHPIYRKLVDQKVRYLLARPWAVETEDKAYGEALETLFDATFRPGSNPTSARPGSCAFCASPPGSWSRCGRTRSGASWTALSVFTPRWSTWAGTSG